MQILWHHRDKYIQTWPNWFQILIFFPNFPVEIQANLSLYLYDYRVILIDYTHYVNSTSHEGPCLWQHPIRPVMQALVFSATQCKFICQESNSESHNPQLSDIFTWYQIGNVHRYMAISHATSSCGADSTTSICACSSMQLYADNNVCVCTHAHALACPSDNNDDDAPHPLPSTCDKNSDHDDSATRMPTRPLPLPHSHLAMTTQTCPLPLPHHTLSLPCPHLTMISTHPCPLPPLSLSHDDDSDGRHDTTLTLVLILQQ